MINNDIYRFGLDKYVPRRYYSDLKNKVILVTGAARGIGKHISLALAAQGAHVVFNYRGDEAKAATLKEELVAAGGQASGLKFDVTDYEAMTKELDNFTKTVAPISGLVNNAGISKDTLLLRLKPDEISSIIDTNLKGCMLVTQALSRNFLKAENVSIVNMGSIVGLMGNPSQAAYAASKAIGTEAEEVLAYLSTLIMTFSGGKPKRFPTASMILKFAW